jgi:hypothetical protein
LRHKEIRIGTALASAEQATVPAFSQEDTVFARNLVLSSALLLPLFTSTPVEAQRVKADIRIGGGPVSGRIVIGDRNRYDRRPRVVRRVEWVRRHDNRRDDWYRNFRREHRVVIVYYDRRDDHYYLDRFHSGLIEIRVYERDGRYYRLDDDREYGRYDDRYDSRYDDRYDNRYDDRYGRDDRRDDRWDDRKDNRKDDRRDDRRGDRRGKYDDR